MQVLHGNMVKIHIKAGMLGFWLVLEGFLVTFPIIRLGNHIKPAKTSEPS